MVVQKIWVEKLSAPIGLGVSKPSFTWQLTSDKRNAMQTAYEIKVASTDATVWNSGKMVSDQSVAVMYNGTPLQSGRKYNVQVRVWDNNGGASEWSSPASFQTGLLQTSDWKAKWITPGYKEDSVMRPSPLFRKEFLLNKPIASATAYVTCHGLYEAHLNGKRIGDAYLTPGWTSYKKRLQYQAYDVTELLKQGDNAIGVTLGNGWYRGIIGFANNVNVYGKDIALLMQIDVVYNDGTKESVATDGSWKSSTGEIQYAEIYNGETLNASMAKKGWLLADYNDKAWSGVNVAPFSLNNIIATQNEPVKKHETFTPVKIFTTPKGEHVIDFGQNLVGWVIVKAKGNKGDSIKVSHAEVLDKEGNFYTENLRQARAEDVYILNGTSEEIFEPHFTWHGFRYAKIEGYPGEPKPENFTAVALYSDMQPTGSFQTSNALLNQLQHNIQWGQKGNFLDVPTDCPQRDERLGWTGDAQAFSRTASFNMKVDAFFTKWLQDLAADQDKGSVPFVIPNVLGGVTSSAGWADVATIIPWNMYLAYGDKALLQQQYPSMKAYVESIRRVAPNNLWQSGFHFGDWLFYRPLDDNDGRSAVTDKHLIAQCFYAHSTQLLLNAANVLNKKEDIVFYTTLLQKIKAAFVKEYVTRSGRLLSNTQTAYVLALQFDMLPESERKGAAQRLVDNVQSYGYHLTTGFLGTPYICHVLSRYGYGDAAYQLLLQDTYPSWLYPVKMGATTIWERWDGMRPDSSFQTPGMNSFNHYAYGAIGDWMYRVMVGLDTKDEAPGYKQSVIKPHIGGGLTSASATLQTFYGTLSNAWRLEGDDVVMNVQIPANTTSTVYLPAKSINDITEDGGKLVTQKVAAETANGYVVIKRGSGSYSFRVANGAAALNKSRNLEDYAGTYRVQNGMIDRIDVKVQAGKILIAAFNNESEAFPVAGIADRFTGDNNANITFERDAKGQVNKIKLTVLGMLYEGKK